jgi:putative DNA-invertase from lambdoid prophage Rac
VTPSRPTTAAIYVRVSTQDQSHDMQQTELVAHAERMGWQPILYAEKASSVKKRPVLDKLMRDARERKFDVVMVWKLDRFARSLAQFVSCVSELDANGIRFIASTQGIDTDQRNPASRLMMQIFAAFAEFERALIVERVRAGMAEAKRQGKHCGRPAPIWDRARAQQLRAAGESWRTIAAALGQPEASIRRTLGKMAA